MGHTYVSTLMHCVFSTKGRMRALDAALRGRLFPYFGGIGRENGFRVLATGGVEDHVHLLLGLPATLAVAKGLQLLKGGSSKWIHDTFPNHADFGWQQGYGAFSIGISSMGETIAYIHNQEEHHRKRDFKTEFSAFLKKHGIEYDPRYVFE